MCSWRMVLFYQAEDSCAKNSDVINKQTKKALCLFSYRNLGEEYSLFGKSRVEPSNKTSYISTMVATTHMWLLNT